MTEREWLAATQLQPMFERVLRSGLASDRKLSLFAAACLGAYGLYCNMRGVAKQSS